MDSREQKLRLFDHLVGEREQRARNFETKRLNGLEIDGKLKLSRLQNRQFGRLHAFEDLVRLGETAAKLSTTRRP